MSLFCGHKTASTSANVTGTAETVDCLPVMNETRTPPGPAAFEKATDELQLLPKSSPPGRKITAETLWNEICKEMTGNPVVSCAFVTCTTAESFAAPSMSKSHRGRASRRLQEKPTTAIICLTNPVALTANEAPFKEDEWQKIVHAIVGNEVGNGILRVRPSSALVFLMTVLVYSLF
ncbi:SAG family member [Eimeria tenella]|uniref:SAG family member n=1 Tax=Eimeria tenella TaxID=5802 RepID=U6KVK6_EIMTE|nr:SAG family member [Eimeria tenella]CDJ41991.1 SAG family member [Eimeria tenella]|eukprot:XP_013232741.1 SAG family member [Eimeria tenella]